jgi:hypothetical protein
VNYPEGLRPGQSYLAVWPVANQFYIVAVHVQALTAAEGKVS